jgi:hypothetical protein
MKPHRMQRLVAARVAARELQEEFTAFELTMKRRLGQARSRLEAIEHVLAQELSEEQEPKEEPTHVVLESCGRIVAVCGGGRERPRRFNFGGVYDAGRDIAEQAGALAYELAYEVYPEGAETVWSYGAGPQLHVREEGQTYTVSFHPYGASEATYARRSAALAFSVAHYLCTLRRIAKAATPRAVAL